MWPEEWASFLQRYLRTWEWKKQCNRFVELHRISQTSVGRLSGDIYLQTVDIFRCRTFYQWLCNRPGPTIIFSDFDRTEQTTFCGKFRLAEYLVCVLLHQTPLYRERRCKNMKNNLGDAAFSLFPVFVYQRETGQESCGEKYELLTRKLVVFTFQSKRMYMRFESTKS